MVVQVCVGGGGGGCECEAGEGGGDGGVGSLLSLTRLEVLLTLTGRLAFQWPVC